MPATTSTGWTPWLTGLPASGKTSLARALRAQLRSAGQNAIILDSDEVRSILTPQATYTREERDHFYAAIVDLAELLTRYNVNVIISAAASRCTYRNAARERLARFAEVWVRCSLEVCRERDPKELYARADAGEIISCLASVCPTRNRRHRKRSSTATESPMKERQRLLPTFGGWSETHAVFELDHKGTKDTKSYEEYPVVTFVFAVPSW